MSGAAIDTHTTVQITCSRNLVSSWEFRTAARRSASTEPYDPTRFVGICLGSPKYQARPRESCQQFVWRPAKHVTHPVDRFAKICADLGLWPKSLFFSRHFRVLERARFYSRARVCPKKPRSQTPPGCDAANVQTLQRPQTRTQRKMQKTAPMSTRDMTALPPSSPAPWLAHGALPWTRCTVGYERWLTWCDQPLTRAGPCAPLLFCCFSQDANSVTCRCFG